MVDERRGERRDQPSATTAGQRLLANGWPTHREDTMTTDLDDAPDRPDPHGRCAACAEPIGTRPRVIEFCRACTVPPHDETEAHYWAIGGSD
jgi:hypothetical protein